MDSYISAEMLTGIKKAEKRARLKNNRLCVHIGERVIKIVKSWENGFALRQSDNPPLRAQVDIYDGPRHLSQGLIMVTAQQDDLTFYEYKRVNDVMQHAPLDYAKDSETPIALLE